ncbi:Ribonuclease P protein component 4 [uncultured archaeon]|nr:Ribonuclease P protein component 4 [uncultured archaeon]
MKNESLVRKVALGRIARLLDMARDRTIENTEKSRMLAKRYTRLAREIASHYRIRRRSDAERTVCKKCGNLLVPGINCKVRLASSKGYVAYVCECGEEAHLHYKEKA